MIINSALQAQKLIESATSNQNSSAAHLTKQFSSYLNEALQSVSGQLEKTEHLRTAFIAGEGTDVHTLMIEAEKAQLGLELTVQVRNKVIEAYQEIMRTQI